MKVGCHPSSPAQHVSVLMEGPSVQVFHVPPTFLAPIQLGTLKVAVKNVTTVTMTEDSSEMDNDQWIHLTIAESVNAGMVTCSVSQEIAPEYHVVKPTPQMANAALAVPSVS